MADYCMQCSVALFGEDFRDLAGLCEPGALAGALCEGCGSTVVDCDGQCCANDAHGIPWRCDVNHARREMP